jgi:hypothetical protein
MKELVEVIARALVDHPDDVKVETVDGPQATIVELTAGAHGKGHANAARCFGYEGSQALHARNRGRLKLPPNEFSIRSEVRNRGTNSPCARE